MLSIWWSFWIGYTNEKTSFGLGCTCNLNTYKFYLFIIVA